MLIRCFFGGKPCSADDFEWEYNYNYGNCFIFNAGTRHNIKNITQSGFNNGLILELFIGAPVDDASASGIEIFLSNHTDMPFKNTEILIPTGFKTRLAVNKVVNQRLENPYSSCINESPTISSLNISYSQDVCMDLCYQKVIIQNCGCFDPRYPPLECPNQCLSLKEFVCILTQYRQFLEGTNFFNKY